MAIAMTIDTVSVEIATMIAPTTIDMIVHITQAAMVNDERMSDILIIIGHLTNSLMMSLKPHPTLTLMGLVFYVRCVMAWPTRMI
jgi:hypothetical protein